MSARSGLVGKKTSWPHLGPFQANFPWTKRKTSGMFANFPWWANGCYSTALGQFMQTQHLGHYGTELGEWQPEMRLVNHLPLWMEMPDVGFLYELSKSVPCRLMISRSTKHDISVMRPFLSSKMFLGLSLSLRKIS